MKRTAVPASAGRRRVVWLALVAMLASACVVDRTVGWLATHDGDDASDAARDAVARDANDAGARADAGPDIPQICIIDPDDCDGGVIISDR